MNAHVSPDSVTAPESQDTWTVAGRTFTSRLIVGTGKYKDYATNAAAARAAGAQIVTVAVRRVNLTDPTQPLLVDYVKPTEFTFLPNTAGCFTGEDAVRTQRLAREAGGWDLVKLEVLSDPKTLYPDMEETLRSLKLLVAEGFQVMVYCSDDPVYCRKLEEAGAVAIMPLGAPIGSGLGIQNRVNLRIIVENAKVPVLVDAGVGTASDAAIGMELGCDAILMNTAIAEAKDPIRMARAMKHAVIAGREAYLAGRMPNSTYWCYPHTDVEGLYRAAYDGRIPDQVPIFLTSATTKDPGNTHAAPPGHSTLEVMCLVPHGTFWPGGDGYSRNAEYLARKERLTEQLIDRASSVIPDLRQHIVWREASSPVTQERFTLSSLGSCYGIEMAADQIGPRRPSPRTEIRGLWLTGASTIWGSGIVGAVSGGLGTAGAILRRPLSAEVKAGAVLADPAKLTPIGPDWDPLAASKPSSPLRRRLRGVAAP